MLKRCNWLTVALVFVNSKVGLSALGSDCLFHFLGSKNSCLWHFFSLFILPILFFRRAQIRNGFREQPIWIGVMPDTTATEEGREESSTKDCRSRFIQATWFRLELHKVVIFLKGRAREPGPRIWSLLSLGVSLLPLLSGPHHVYPTSVREKTSETKGREMREGKGGKKEKFVWERVGED